MFPCKNWGEGINTLVANNVDLNKENTQLQIFGSKMD